MLRPLRLQNPANRWERQHREYEEDRVPTHSLQVFQDDSQSILSKNDSPDVSFRYSVNPYRGCAHGCAYCYARPSHEYLGFGSGTDFERKLLAKPRAAELLREAFERKGWSGEELVISGNTDCYQPLEAEMGLTRSCLEVCLQYRNPVHIITKSTLVERDLELLCELAKKAAASVSISVPFLDSVVARAIEPYAPAPARRIETIRRLSAAGIPVNVMVAPIVPGLSDRDLIPILEQARAAGALSAACGLLRLPGSVAQVFESRLREHLPEAADRVLARTREARGGRINDSRFFTRMRGEGAYAATLQAMFSATIKRLGFENLPSAPAGTFRRPDDKGQLRLFEPDR